METIFPLLYLPTHTAWLALKSLSKDPAWKGQILHTKILLVTSRSTTIKGHRGRKAPAGWERPRMKSPPSQQTVTLSPGNPAQKAGPGEASDS